MGGEQVAREKRAGADVVTLPGVETRLTAEYALRVVIDSQVFSALRDFEPLDGGRAVQAVYVALLRRLPNVVPDRRRISIDSGFSESSVKRAIKLLEEAGLIVVVRAKGFSSTYQITDLRSSESASVCLTAIRKMVRAIGRETAGSRVTSEPGKNVSRVSSGPTGRATCEPGGGSLLTHKDTNKNQSKQQAAAAEKKSMGQGTLRATFERWGLSSASYLAEPGNERALPELVGDPELAERLIERAMRQTRWSADAGVGARVAYLRAQIPHVASNVELETAQARGAFQRARLRAASLVSRLSQLDTIEGRKLDVETFDALFERGLIRLSETPEVLQVLRRSAAARESIVAEELLFQSLEAKLKAMTQPEFTACCERLFDSEPGLRRMLGNSGLESPALRYRLIEFLRQSSLGRSDSAAKSGVPNHNHSIRN